MSGRRPKGWHDHEPSRLVALAKQQHPDRPRFAAALRDCTSARWRGRGRIYLQFIEVPEAERSGIVAETIPLESPVVGLLMVEVTKDGRIYGIEFYDRLFR